MRDIICLRRTLLIGLMQVPAAVVVTHGIHHCRVAAVSARKLRPDSVCLI